MVLRGTLILSLFFVSANAFSSTLSFKEWKHRRVAEKSSVVAQLKREMTNSSEPKQAKFAQALFNLQTEKDLTPDDYFHLYLSEQFKHNPENAREAAKKLSKEELADIVVSYINANNQLHEIESNPSRLQTSR